MERRKHWWNGRFANTARRDVYMWNANWHWCVEVSRGGLNRRLRTYDYDNELAALIKADAVMGSAGDEWREVAI